MKQSKIPPQLPSGMITVKKGRFPDILVGVMNSYRGLAQGFDVAGFAPNHFRTIENGQFTVLVAAKTGVEVRVILDGKMLFEGIRQPMQPPMSGGMGIDKSALAIMLEKPQPHFFDADGEGNPFMFTAPDSSLTDDEIINEQLHPGLDGPSITMEQMQGGEKMVQVRQDFDPAIFFNKMKARAAEMDAEIERPELSAPVDVPQDLLTAPISEDELNGAASGFRCESVDGVDDSASVEAHGIAGSDQEVGAAVNAFAAGQSDDEGASAAELAADLLPLVDPALRAMTLAPGNGFLVIGVRAIQKASEHEPPSLPDAFSYVGFQLNPWKLHTRALSKLMSRVIVPSKESLDETMRKQGFDNEIPAKGFVCACCNGRPH